MECKIKRCAACKIEKPLTDFYISHGIWRQNKCKPCWAGETSRNRIARRYRHKQRQRIIDLYGGKCQCCGESIHEFLELDHVEGNGAAHRKMFTRERFLSWALSERRVEIQLLCSNCNQAKGKNVTGTCPHLSMEIIFSGC